MGRHRPPAQDATPVHLELPIRNVNRTVGTILGNRVTVVTNGEGLPENTIDLTLRGTAGQSFGAFLPRGITLRLVGDSNDYFAKGLSGGRLIVRPARSAPFVAEEQIIAGNVIAYGATSGELLIRGMVGERFCVRNSGATAIVEGVGDHGCEYMTGGTVVVLGMTGRNFAAGMSGGIAYVLDEDGTFKQRANLAQVALEKVLPASRHAAGEPLHLGMADETLLKDLVTRHVEYTGSETAKRILANWDASREKFVKVYPHEYKRALTEMAAAQKEAA